ncbi:MAG: pyruvate ferredoxin oxidoreductase [Betaproteobacteria bacterium]
MTTRIIEGTHAVSWAVQRSRVKVIAAYPITPSSGVVELLSELCATGQLDARFVAVESEHSALATCAGASQTGLRAFTATSSHGLLYMHEMLHWCAGARLPIVLANVNRAVGSPWNIFADQNDSLSQRDTGWIQYYCENNQEVLDTILQAFRVAEQVLLPAMVCLDAFFLSHTSEPVSIPGQEEVDAYLPPFRPPFVLSPAEPHAFGGLPAADGYMELRARIEESMRRAESVAREADQAFAGRFGRAHPIVESYRTEDADVLLVASGTVAGTARAVVDSRRAAGERVGLVKIHLFRPFPFDAVRAAVSGARKLAIVDRNISFGHGGIMASEIRSALCGRPGPEAIFSFVAGLGGRDITTETLEDILAHTTARAQAEDDTLWVGLKES